MVEPHGLIYDIVADFEKCFEFLHDGAVVSAVIFCRIGEEQDKLYLLTKTVQQCTYLFSDGVSVKAQSNPKLLEAPVPMGPIVWRFKVEWLS